MVRSFLLYELNDRFEELFHTLQESVAIFDTVMMNLLAYFLAQVRELLYVLYLLTLFLLMLSIKTLCNGFQSPAH